MKNSYLRECEEDWVPMKPRSSGFVMNTRSQFQQGNLKDKKEAHFDLYEQKPLSNLLERGFFYVKIKGGRKMGATGCMSQRKTIEESIGRNKEK